MKNIYIIELSSGSWDDARTTVLNDCYTSLTAAEKRKTEIEALMREVPPFPFDWCTEDTIDEDELSKEDNTKYFVYWMAKNESYDFNGATILTLNLI